MFYGNLTLIFTVFRLSGLHTVRTIELIDTSASGSSFLLAGIIRMALGADFYVDVLLRRTGYELVTAVANNLCLIVIGLDSFLHDIHLTYTILYIILWLLEDSRVIREFLRNTPIISLNSADNYNTYYF